MTRIGILGMGFMGRTHYEAYQSIPGAQVVAFYSRSPRKAGGDLSGGWGNLGTGNLAQLPMDKLRGTTDWREVIKAKDLDVVDVCVPTPMHAEVTLAALRHGKHVICEKPLALTLKDAKRIAKAAGKARGIFMPAMCVRFWPGWSWLKDAVTDRRYGAVRSATFRRVCARPGDWFADGAQSGGALLDLHVHDVDFIRYLWGSPRKVFSRGFKGPSHSVEQVVTQYLYDAPGSSGAPAVVTAEAGWMTPPHAFSSRYTVVFDHATVDLDTGRAEPVMIHHEGQSTPMPLPGGDGFTHELAYFIDCVAHGLPPQVVTVDDAVEVIRVIEAEAKSIERGVAVRV